MKKFLSLILAVAMLCALTLTLTSCGELTLEGTYQGAFFLDEKDTLTITFKEGNVVEMTLVDGTATYKATGTYKIEADTTEGHDHQLMSFDIKGDIGTLSYLQNVSYAYSLEEVDGQKQLALSSHGGTVTQNMTFTEVKK